MSVTEMEDLEGEFVTQASFLGAEVVLSDLTSLPSALAELVPDGGSISSDLLEALPGLAAGGLTVRESADSVLTRAHLGVARTGSILIAERTREDRLLPILARRHVALLPRGAIVPGIDDAVPYIRDLIVSGISHLTLVSGPSRTADIEKVLAIGAHGPRELVVILLADWSRRRD